jgi:hypothetical protein
MRVEEERKKVESMNVREPGSANIHMPKNLQFFVLFFSFFLLTFSLTCFKIYDMKQRSDAQPNVSPALYRQQNFQINELSQRFFKKTNFRREKWKGFFLTGKVCFFGESVHLAWGNHARDEILITTGGKRNEKKDRKIFYAGPVADYGQRLLDIRRNHRTYDRTKRGNGDSQW